MRPASLEREVLMLRRLSEANHPALVRFIAHVRPSEIEHGEIRANSSLPLTRSLSSYHALVRARTRSTKTASGRCNRRVGVRGKVRQDSAASCGSSKGAGSPHRQAAMRSSMSSTSEGPASVRIVRNESANPASSTSTGIPAAVFLTIPARSVSK